MLNTPKREYPWDDYVSVVSSVSVVSTASSVVVVSVSETHDASGSAYNLDRDQR